MTKRFINQALVLGLLLAWPAGSHADELKPTSLMATTVNSSCLIALELVGRLDLLRGLYGTVVVPRAGKSGSGC